MKTQYISPILIAVLLMGGLLHPISTARATGASFQRDIAPVFMNACLDCHRAGKSKGGYRLDTFDRMLQPGESGKTPFTPGNPEKSHLLDLLKSADPDDRMPQKADALPRDQVEAIERWIRAGLPFDGPSRTHLISEWESMGPKSEAPEEYARAIPVTGLAICAGSSNSPALLAVGGYHELLIWNPLIQRRLGRIAGLPERILSVITIPGRTEVVVVGGTPGRRGEVWWIPSMTETTQPPRRILMMPEEALCAAASPDGKWFAVGGGDQSLRVYSIVEAQWLPTVEGHSDWVLHVAFSEDSTRLGTASRDKSAKVFTLPGMEQASAYYEHQEPVLSLIFPPQKTQVLTSARNGQWHLWDQVEAKKKKDLGPPDDDLIKMEAITIAEEKLSLILGLTRSGQVLVYAGWDPPQKRQVMEPSALEGEIVSLVWDPIHRELWTGTDRGLVLGWAWKNEGGFRRQHDSFSPFPRARR